MRPHAPVATLRHTARLTAIFVGLGVAGGLLRSHGASAAAGATAPNLLVLYSSLTASEWLLFRAVKAGLRSTNTLWRKLIGGPFDDPFDAGVDVVVGLAVCGIWIFGVLPGAGNAAAAMLPRGAVESAAWILLSLSAGFCEELVFRGYFQRQFAALSGSRAVGMIAQATLFGLAHGYQGWRSVLAIAGYGMALGAIAEWRGSLRAGMVAHAVTDLTLGLLRR
jgi:membrane protease YdiL (CAAX protease family)